MAAERFEVRSGAATLAGEEIGDGDAVVLLHAGVADRRCWRGVMHALSDSVRLLAYDRRGFGETAYEPETFAHADDLVAVLDARGVDRAVLVGNSQGGRIAIDTALAHPDRVRGLVLIAPAVTGAPPVEDAPADVVAMDEEAEAAYEDGDLDRANQLEARLWLDGPSVEEGRVGGDARELFLEMNGVALRAADPGEERPAPSAWERLEDLDAPVLVLTGDLDLPHLLTRADELTARIAGARAEVLGGTAHLPMLEDAARVADAIAGFLDRVSDRA